jgi:Family of unknown function (DUF6114)
VTTEPDAGNPAEYKPTPGNRPAPKGSPAPGSWPAPRRYPGQRADTAAEATGSADWKAASAWRGWRHSRPFWGGLFVIAGGTVTILTERAPLPLVVHIGIQGAAGYLLPIVLVLCGLLLWFNPAQRTFYGILSVLLALGTWITSNLGGFFIGMVLGLVGGSLAFAWEPRESPPPLRPVKSPPPQLPPQLPPAGLSLILRGSDDEPEDDGPEDDEPEADSPGETTLPLRSDPARPEQDETRPSHRTESATVFGPRRLLNARPTVDPSVTRSPHVLVS